MKTFRHAGDLGDICASLPVIRYFGGGILYIEASHYTRQKLTPARWCGIDLLLKQQPYIEDVLPWSGERVDYNLNDFRARMFPHLRMGRHKDKSLIDWMLETHGVPLTAKNEAWLTVKPNSLARVVFNRTGPGREAKNQYHNPNFPWHKVWRKYARSAVFVGTPAEHEHFSAVCGTVPYQPTASLLEAAQVIAGAELFVGNQSCCFWIAEGLKKNIVLEVWPAGPNSLVPREGVYHGWNEKVELPELKVSPA